MRKHKLILNNIYHIYNRGVEKRKIFLEDRDYKRFIRNLIIFNDIKAVTNIEHKNIEQIAINREFLVDVLAFCLMPNHFHLLLRQVTENGITKFMRKIGTGYANYFNVKYARVGALFQGKFKSVLIDNESQFIYIPHYIHLNPIDLIMPEWREKNLSKPRLAMNFLNSYKWSSYSDYTGKPRFTLVINKDILGEYFSGTEGYYNDLESFIKDLDISNITDIILE